jgi:hypothetical protein
MDNRKVLEPRLVPEGIANSPGPTTAEQIFPMTLYPSRGSRHSFSTTAEDQTIKLQQGTPFTKK